MLNYQDLLLLYPDKIGVEINENNIDYSRSFHITLSVFNQAGRL